MKITSLIFTSLTVNPVTFFLPNKHPKTWLHNKEIVIKPNTDIYNKDAHKVDLKKDKDKWIFEPDAPVKFLINKDDSKLIHDPRNSVFEIQFKYIMDFNNTKEDRRISDIHYFDKNMKLEKVKSGNKNIVETGSKENRITYNNKDDKVALQVKPFMKLDINDFETDITSEYLGHYHMKLEEIYILVSYYLFDFTDIKMKPIHIKLEYLKEDWHYKVKSELIDLVLHEYGINEVIDIDKTLENFKWDEINFLKPNRFFVELVSDESWYTKGKINQEIIIEFDRHSLEDLENVNELYSSNLYQKIYERYIDESALDLRINLDKNEITIKSPGKVLNRYVFKKFINDGPLQNFQKYKSVEVVKDREIIGTYKNKILDIKDIEKLDHLFDEYKGDKEDDDQINDQEITSNVDSGKDNLSDEESAADVEEIKIKTRKSSPLKYLWLLTIPFCLGIFCLITWLIPLIKRKK